MSKIVEKENVNFGVTQSDVVALLLKSGVSLVPFVGSALSEIVASSIPNQRIDRIVKFLHTLQSVLTDEFLEKLKSLPDKISMIEEGMLAVMTTPHNERLERISYVVANGLTKDDVEADTVSKFISVAKQISDYDYIVLCASYMCSKNVSEGLSFQKKYPYIWPSLSGNPFGSEDDKIKYEKYSKEKDIASEKVLSSERYLASLSVLKPNKINVNYHSSEGVVSAIEDLALALSDESYCITSFGVNFFEAMQKP